MKYGRSASIKSASDALLNKIASTKANISETSINSAALQDHIMQSYNLGAIDPFGRKPRAYKKPAYMDKYSKSKMSAGGRPLSNAGRNIMQKCIGGSEIRTLDKYPPKTKHQNKQ
jgi:hypothetical protein